MPGIFHYLETPFRIWKPLFFKILIITILPCGTHVVFLKEY